MKIFALLAVGLLGAGTASAQSAPARMAAVRDLVIGSVEGGPAAFGRVSALTVGPDGSIYVGDDQNAEVRVFDSRGRHLRSFGRRGQGPGDFQSVRTMGWRGDTLWVTDRAEARATLFTPSGTAVRTISPQVPIRQRGVLGFGPEAILEDGSLLASAVTRADVDLPEWPPLLRVRSDGAVLDTLFVLDLSNTSLSLTGDGGRIASLSASQPLADHPRYSIAPDGSAVVRVDRRAARRRDGATYRVTRIAASTGDTLFSRTWRYTPRPVPARMVDSLVSLWTERATGRAIPSAARAERAVREALYLPAFLPTVTAVVAGRDGTAWLRREEPMGASVRWTILDPRGAPAAEVMLPRGARVMAAERNTAWAVVQGEFDEQYVVRYRLRPARAGR